MTTGEFLKELRMQKGMTQESVAEALNISHIAYVRYECGTRMPKQDILEKLANLYGVTKGEILNGERMKTSSKDLMFALFGGADGVTDKDLEDVKQYAQFILAKKQGFGD